MYCTGLVISVMAVRVDESNSRFSLAFFHPTTAEGNSKIVLEVFGTGDDVKHHRAGLCAVWDCLSVIHTGGAHGFSRYLDSAEIRRINFPNLPGDFQGGFLVQKAPEYNEGGKPGKNRGILVCVYMFGLITLTR